MDICETVIWWRDVSIDWRNQRDWLFGQKETGNVVPSFRLSPFFPQFCLRARWGKESGLTFSFRSQRAICEPAAVHIPSLPYPGLTVRIDPQPSHVGP